MDELGLARHIAEKFERVIIHRDSEQSSVTQRLLDLLPSEKIHWVQAKPFANHRGALSATDFDRSKRTLYLEPFKGQFFKRCPGARPGLMCCNYFVLNMGQQCDMNCSYCYLQSFINFPALTIYTNLEAGLAELADIGKSVKDQSLRVGTGEVIDSLSLDPLTLYSRQLIEFFRDYPRWTVEFKSKSDYVDQFLDCEHAGNVIVSWSINPQFIIDREEHGTAPLLQRLLAAQKCLDRGFQVSFHLDPMVWHPEWKTHYTELVDELASRFSPDQIPYLSVGALRFQPEQRHLMRERFGMKSLVTQAETFPSRDGKWRYDHDIRAEMFKCVLDRFETHDPNWKIFLCMETPESWSLTDSVNPVRSPRLGPLFDATVTKSVRSAQTSCT